MLDPEFRNEDGELENGALEKRQPDVSPQHDPQCSGFDLDFELPVAQIANKVLKALVTRRAAECCGAEIAAYYQSECLHAEAVLERRIVFNGITRALAESEAALSPDFQTVDRGFLCLSVASDIVLLAAEHSLQGAEVHYGKMINEIFELADRLISRIERSAVRSNDYLRTINALAASFSIETSFGKIPDDDLCGSRFDYVKDGMIDFISSVVVECTDFDSSNSSAEGARAFPAEYSIEELKAIEAVVAFAGKSASRVLNGHLVKFIVQLENWLRSQPSAYLWRDDSAYTRLDAEAGMAPELRHFQRIEDFYITLIHAVAETAPSHVHSPEFQKLDAFLWDVIENNCEGWIGWAPVLASLIAISPKNFDRVRTLLRDVLIEPMLASRPELALPLCLFVREGREQMELVASLVRSLIDDDRRIVINLIREVAPRLELREDFMSVLTQMIARDKGSFFDEESEGQAY